MRYGSLFSGIGGELGFEQAGMSAVWQVERDPRCREVLARHWPDVQRFDDVCTVGAHNLEPTDLICAGWPCQDLSVAGKRAGLAGERSGLWFEVLRILGELRPRWFVGENVPGLLSSRGGRDFAIVLHGLVQLGYGVAWRVLDAQYHGVAQRRRRVFIVASLGDGRAAQVLFEPESLRWDSAPSRSTGEGAAGTLGGGAGSRGWAPDTDRMTFVPYTAYALTVDAAKFGAGVGHGVHGGQALMAQPFTFQSRIARNGRGAPADVVPALAGSDAGETSDARPLVVTKRGLAGEVPETLRANSHGALPMVGVTIHGTDKTAHVASYTDIAGSLRTKPPGSQENSSTTAIQQGMAVRRLTPTECERLQGFPDGWTAGQPDSARYKQLGNAWCVAPVRWLGERIMAAKAD